jgi:hypothetical protein
VFTQEPPQFVAPAVHNAAHALLLHTSGAVQVVPQAPQLAGSSLRSTHTPLQLVVGAGHAQVPALHSKPCAHVLPQAPQLSSSVCVSTQLAPHCVRAVPQDETHAPLLHVSPAPQTLPHAPQLFGSLPVGTQTPLQSASPTGHAHAPSTQD